MNYLDLSSNRIKSINGLLPYLIECHTLLLDDNIIEHLRCIESELPNADASTVASGKLKVLSLKRNPIEKNQNSVSKIRNSVLKDIVVFT